MQPTGAKKDFLWAVVTAAATTVVVKLAEFAFDTAKQKIEKACAKVATNKKAKASRKKAIS